MRSDFPSFRGVLCIGADVKNRNVYVTRSHHVNPVPSGEKAVTLEKEGTPRRSTRFELYSDLNER